jgi:hypothetical protein
MFVGRTHSLASQLLQGIGVVNGIGAHYRLAVLCDKWEHPDNTFAKTAQQD